MNFMLFGEWFVAMTEYLSTLKRRVTPLNVDFQRFAPLCASYSRAALFQCVAHDVIGKEQF